MTEEHNIPEEQTRSDSNIGIITKLQKELEEQKQQNVHQARRIDNLSTTIGDYQKVFQVLAEQIGHHIVHDNNDDAINDWMDNNATDKINKYIENNGSLEDSVNEIISNGCWDITFSG
tara:strand:- start:209 stop:562 length:354 start_codon:yes stop_codon:yes gene_type:complete